jgi:hypothetical protein
MALRTCLESCSVFQQQIVGMGPKVTAGDAAGVAEDLGTLQSLFMAAQTAFTKEKVGGAADLAKSAAAAAGDAQKGRKIR